MSTLSKHLDEIDILLERKAASKREVFQVIGQHMQTAHGVSAESVESSLLRRESAGSTALGCGVAIPHARVNELERIRLLYLRVVPALAFDSPDGEPVSDIVALMVPAPATQEHLDVLAHVASLFSDKAFRKALHKCEEPGQVMDVIANWPHWEERSKEAILLMPQGTRDHQ